MNNNSIGKDVYFDNIKIEHYAGTLLEENHYYPYGLTVSQAASGATAPENPYKYQTKELERSFSVEIYDFHARIYNPQIGRTSQLDPMAPMFAPISPYSWSLNNPVSYIDPTGMVVEPASQKEWDKQKQALTAERDRVQGRIDRLNTKAAEKGWSAEKLANRIGDRADRVTSMNGSLATLGTLESSAQVYSLKSIGQTDDGGTTYDPKTGNIVIAFGNTANFIHESAHAGQFESGDLAFGKTTGNPVGQDIQDEVASYKAQYGYDPSSVSGLNSSSVASSFRGITNTWVQGITNAAGQKPYGAGGNANTGLIPININSSQSDLIKAYPQFKSVLQAGPATYNLRSDSDVYYKNP